jgi:uncharacterized membrane protein YfcA
LGLFAGGYGTLIGAGGGFILAPTLLLIYPGEAPETLTVISLSVVFFNSLSGTLAYLRSGRIEFKSGSIFALATMPGAVVGALTTAAISRARFNQCLAFCLSSLVFWRSIHAARVLGQWPREATLAAESATMLSVMVSTSLVLSPASWGSAAGFFTFRRWFI